MMEADACENKMQLYKWNAALFKFEFDDEGRIEINLKLNWIWRCGYEKLKLRMQLCRIEIDLKLRM